MAVNETTAEYNIAELLSNTRHQRTSPCLIMVSGESSVGKLFKLEKAEICFGRSSDADIKIEDETVSRLHAKIVTNPDGTKRLIDLHSKNGTFVNGLGTKDVPLQDGDKIQIGIATVFRFSYHDTLDEACQINLYESATRDGLTQVHNKKFFLDTVSKEFAYCLRHQVTLSLVLIDIDHFKKVNDTWGHLAGDYVLSSVATRISETIRAEDIFARYGGEEFVLLLREVPEEKAFLLADRLRRLIETTKLVFQGHPISVTISAGISSLHHHECNCIESFIASADQQLYRAKQAGRNCVKAQQTNCTNQQKLP